MKKINTDNSTFEEIIRNGELYVDKTMYILPLLGKANHMFSLARPDGFGKSLFSSTLHALFEGKKELFRGLYIEDKYSFERYPVIHFDFSGIDVDSKEHFSDCLSKYIKMFGTSYGIVIEDGTPGMMLEDLITGLYARYGVIVIIIDEFDAPLTNAINEPQPTFEFIRNTFNRFYVTIKKYSSMIQFFFMTGVTRRIFSSFNNVVDISLDPRFGVAFGYTNEELEKYFGEALDNNWKKECSSRDEFISKLNENYGGYCFSSETDVKVYNPRSIGKFFTSGCDFNGCWMNEDPLSLIINTGMKDELLSLKDERNFVDSFGFAMFDISDFHTKKCHPDVIALLYFSGYLTVKEASGRYSSVYNLEIPNREAMRSLEKVIGSIR